MHHGSSATAVVVLSVLAVAAARSARAADVESPTPTRALGRPDLPTPAAPIAVEPRPLGWRAPSAEDSAPTATLVGGCGACRHECGTCGCADRCWRVALTIPIWVPSVSSTFTSGDVSTSADRNPHGIDGIFDKFLPDAATSFEFAFLGRVNVTHGPWTLAADGFYVSLAETVDWKVRDEDTTGSFEGGVARVYGAWQTKLPLGCSPCAPCLAIGPMVGARLFSLALHVNQSNGNDVDRSATWVDPVVGLKADLTFANGASIDVLADYGGMLDGTHTSWSVSAELTWPLGHGGHWFLLAGWTLLGFDYDVGTGSDEYKVNLDLSGPHIGVTYRF